MMRNHRAWHAWTWLVLGPFLAAAFVVGLLARPKPTVEPGALAAPAKVPEAAGLAHPREATP